MIKYKLTTQDLKTYNGFQWIVGQKVTTSGKGELCSTEWLHYYHHPLLAIFLNPIHANIKNPKLWEIEAEGIHKDNVGLKGGCTEMTLLREIPMSEITTTQRVVFGILCAKEVYKDPEWNTWADKWLSGEDRKRSYAIVYNIVAASAANAAAYATAFATAFAAYHAANAAETKLNLVEIAELSLTYK